MAAKYRKVDPRIWDDEVFDNLDAADALAAMWLVTGRAVNRAGVVVCGLGEAADKCRRQGVDEAWDTLSRVCLSFDWPLQKVGRNTVVIILKTWFRYNQPTNEDHFKGMLSDLTDVPRCDLLKQYKNLVKTDIREDWHKHFDRVSPEPSTGCPSVDSTPTPDQKQKQKQKQDTETEAECISPSGDDGTSPEDVFEAWNQSGAATKVRKLTEERKRKLRTRLNDPEWPWREAIDKLPIPNTAKFDWQPDFDWLIENGTNAVKLAEGKYSRAGPAAVGAGQTFNESMQESFGSGF